MSVERFDKEAAGWDAKPQRVRLAHGIAQSIITTLPLSKTMTGLEYGCGTGLVSLEIANHIHRVHGVDSSSGMITVLEDKIREQGVVNVVPFHGDLTDMNLPPLDLIFMSMTLHHIEDYDPLLRRFAHLLKPGGFLALADLVKEDGTFHDDNTGIAHFGFEPDVLSGQAVSYGFTAVQTQTIFTLEKNDRDYPVFLLTARKA